MQYIGRVHFALKKALKRNKTGYFTKKTCKTILQKHFFYHIIYINKLPSSL
ncbi:hypothetical protein FPS14_contig00021-0038 [Flavobacterium psychrophilum]|nr:hypothetical protein FPS14_contig00021-0038 [Flavobacterium psychrophilum]